MNPAPIQDVTLRKAPFGGAWPSATGTAHHAGWRLLLLCVLSGACTAAAVWVAAHAARWLAG